MAASAQIILTMQKVLAHQLAHELPLIGKVHHLQFFLLFLPAPGVGCTTLVHHATVPLHGMCPVHLLCEQGMCARRGVRGCGLQHVGGVRAGHSCGVPRQVSSSCHHSRSPAISRRSRAACPNRHATASSPSRARPPEKKPNPWCATAALHCLCAERRMSTLSICRRSPDIVICQHSSLREVRVAF